MKLPGHRSLQEVSRLAKGYPKLVLCLCDHYGIPLVHEDRYTFIEEQHVNEVVLRVAEWKCRPRMSGIGRPKRKMVVHLV